MDFTLRLFSTYNLSLKEAPVDILATPVFDRPLFSLDTIILFENLVTGR